MARGSHIPGILSQARDYSVGQTFSLIKGEEMEWKDAGTLGGVHAN